MNKNHSLPCIIVGTGGASLDHPYGKDTYKEETEISIVKEETEISIVKEESSHGYVIFNTQNMKGIFYQVKPQNLCKQIQFKLNHHNEFMVEESSYLCPPILETDEKDCRNTSSKDNKIILS